MSAEGYDYFAFISYSHNDEKWAKWLHKKLESYRLPSKVAKQTGTKRVRPVFRDFTDLGTGILEESVHKELEKSRYLIVICSPNSAKSDWVDKEVQHFQKLGRSDRIIPFIVEGRPDSNDPLESCYPPSLTGTLLGSSISEISASYALVKVIATILNLKVDQLWLRHKRRQRIEKVKFAVLSLLLLLGVFLAWDYYIPKTSYYADYIERWQVPEGIFPLTKAQIKRRESHYQFIHQYHRLQKVIHANSVGKPFPHSLLEYNYRPIIMDLKYNFEGILIQRVFLNQHGEEVLIQGLDKGVKIVDYLHPGEMKQARPLLKSTTLKSLDSFNLIETDSIPWLPEYQKSEISRCKYQYDNHGFILRELYMRDNRNTPASDANGVFGRIVKHDTIGRVIEVRYLDSQGKPNSKKIGIIGVTYVYDSVGNLIETEDIYPDENPLLDKAITVKTKRKYDEQGNQVSSTTFNSNGIPKPNSEGWVTWKAEYDEKGNRTKMMYFDIEENPVEFLHQGYAGWEAKYDNFGNQIGYTYLGVYGTPIVHRSKGYAGWLSEFDKKGNQITLKYLGIDGNPVLNNFGNYAGWKAIYDTKGNRYEQTHIGIDGEPVMVYDEFAGWRASYDDNNNMTNIYYFGLRGEPVEKGGWKAKYDEIGNITRYLYTGIDGQPVIDYWDQCAGKMFEYDGSGNIIKYMYLGRDGNPMNLDGDDYSGEEIEYDEKGNEIRSVFLGLNGEPTLRESVGIAERKKEYDEYGHLIKLTYLDLRGTPTLHKILSYAEWEAEYDDYGNLLNKSYYDANGNQVDVK